MCKIGGIVVNKSPADFINHGFINLNAEVLRDRYLSNGFEELALKYIAMPTHPRRVKQHYLEYSPEEFRFALRPYYATEVHSAYRKTEEKVLTVPLLGFYRKLYSTGPVIARLEGKGLRAVLSEKVRVKLRNWLDAYFVSSILIRGFVNMRWGKKVTL